MNDIDKKLANASLAGDINLGLSLLGQGADINSRNSQCCTPLMHAANKGHFSYVLMLLERGADRSRKCNDGKTASDWAGGTAKARIQELLESWSTEVKQEEVVRQKDQIIVVSAISNRTLEEVFNFAARERVSLLRQFPGGPVEAMTREDFSDIKNQDIVQKAFEQYKALGGKLTEDDVFPDRIMKVRMPRLGAR